jgi:hypothetical protein
LFAAQITGCSKLLVAMYQPFATTQLKIEAPLLLVALPAGQALQLLAPEVLKVLAAQAKQVPEDSYWPATQGRQNKRDVAPLSELLVTAPYVPIAVLALVSMVVCPWPQTVQLPLKLRADW